MIDTQRELEHASDIGTEKGEHTKMFDILLSFLYILLNQINLTALQKKEAMHMHNGNRDKQYMPTFQIIHCQIHRAHDIR